MQRSCQTISAVAGPQPVEFIVVSLSCGSLGGVMVRYEAVEYQGAIWLPIEPVSSANSPLTGKFTANFIDSGTTAEALTLF
jgi:hypothetical protein